MEWVFILAVGMFAGVVSGIIGTGSSIILLPILVIVFGAKAAVPIMAVAALLANCGRAYVWWNSINWRAVFYYAIPSIPAAALGARSLIVLPENIGNLILGIFFLCMIPLRYWLKSMNVGKHPLHLVFGGALIGYITGIVASSGPLSLAVFSSFGLVKSGLIASEAAASLFVYGSKALTFNHFGILPLATMINGAIVGASITVGTYGAKWALNRISVNQHERIIDIVLFGAGAAILIF